MRAINALRSDPYLPAMFAYVHVLCRPILVWPINRFFSCLKRGGIAAARYNVNRWGLSIPATAKTPAPANPLHAPSVPGRMQAARATCPPTSPHPKSSWLSHASPHQVGGGVIARSAMTKGAFASLSLGSTWPCLSSPLAPG
jgi:hypothetical protein